MNYFYLEEIQNLYEIIKYQNLKKKYVFLLVVTDFQLVANGLCKGSRSNYMMNKLSHGNHKFTWTLKCANCKGPYGS